MDDVLREFLTESSENLVRLERDTVEVERAPGDAALLNSIFRTIHTIKGTCGFLGLERLERVAHAGESVLVLVRDGKLEFSRVSRRPVPNRPVTIPPWSRVSKDGLPAILPWRQRQSRRRCRPSRRRRHNR